MYTSCMKYVLYLAALAKVRFASAILSLGKHCFLPLFSNVNKNKITRSETHIILCLSETE